MKMQITVFNKEAKMASISFLPENHEESQTLKLLSAGLHEKPLDGEFVIMIDAEKDINWMSDIPGVKHSANDLLPKGGDMSGLAGPKKITDADKNPNPSGCIKYRLLPGNPDTPAHGITETICQGKTIKQTSDIVLSELEYLKISHPGSFVTQVADLDEFTHSSDVGYYSLHGILIRED